MSHQPSSCWTLDKITELKRLHEAGYSASQVAKMMGGGATRNSVIGKCHRLGLERHTSRMSVKKTPKAPAQPRPKPTVSTKPLPRPDTPREGVGLLALSRLACRWPVSSPVEPADTLFCGRWVEGGSFCSEHRPRAYSKVVGARENGFVARV